MILEQHDALSGGLEGELAVGGRVDACAVDRVIRIKTGRVKHAERELLQAADERVYLPLRGFADSLNLSVAAALVLHQ